MSDVTEIALALKALLETLPDVDVSSIDEYWPPVETQKIALLIPPYRQQTRVEAKTTQRRVLFQSHQIYCEFWVKVDTGNVAGTFKLAREIGLAACRKLMREDLTSKPLRDTVSKVGWYGTNAPGPTVEARVGQQPIGINGVPFIVVDVTVGVIDYADAES